MEAHIIHLIHTYTRRIFFLWMIFILKCTVIAICADMFSYRRRLWVLVPWDTISIAGVTTSTTGTTARTSFRCYCWLRGHKNENRKENKLHKGCLHLWII